MPLASATSRMVAVFLVLTMPVGIPRRFRAVSSSSAPGNSRVTDTCMGPAFSV
ncbi:Uncharacterised protein [Flavonifractor plautii]|uniref:Uncharacterized protein n=1 Tax=Flavonifractor plautii TaxID=292800 RepID=A0A174GNR9_FLAPL|nr:Uncharacterised protein [Flavonifractor plautii]